MDAKKKAKTVGSVIKQTFREFIDDQSPRMAAALAYYTVFSLPALLVFIVMIAGFFLDPSTIRGEISTQIESLIGAGAASQVETMLLNAQDRTTGGTWAAIMGIAILLFGATGAFAQLQKALNTAWEVEPDKEHGGLKNFIMKRVLSFGMILAVAFLLLVSLVLSAVVSAFGDLLVQWIGGGVGELLVAGIHFAVSLAVITLLFSAIFKILPDADVRWRDVWVGGFVTALLFVLGKFGLGFYLGQSDPGSIYGTAGSLALILIWVYYSSMILLLGAEFTQVWARRYGRQIRPSSGAVRVVEETRPVPEGAQPA